MQKEYIIAFSSFYKAAYAEDLLEAEGIRVTLRKLPIELAKSCSTGIYGTDLPIERVKEIFRGKDIYPRGIYLMARDDNGKTTYTLVR
jgi:hypothetical protein